MKASSLIKHHQKPDKILTYWIAQPFTVVMIVVFGIAFNGLMPWGALQLGKVIDTILIASGPAMIIQALIRYVGVVAFIQVLRFIKRFYIRRFANKTLISMRTHAFNAVLSAPYGSLTQPDPGNLLSRIVGDVDACVEGMRKFTTELFDTGVLMIAYVITMISMDPVVALTSILFVPVAMLIAEKLKTTIVKAVAASRKQNAVVTSLTLEASENALLYRISGVDPIIKANYDKALEDLRLKATKANILENSMQPLYNAIAMAGVAFVILLGGQKVLDGQWTIGTFTAFMTIFAAMALKSSKAAKLFNSVQKSSVSWKRIKPYLIPIQEVQVSEAVDGPVSLSVRDLCFDADGTTILKDVSFDAHNGQLIGITGPVASGKSILLSVLTGVMDYQGSIQINHEELKSMPAEKRSALIAYLPQRPQLFGESLKDNITWESDGDIQSVLDQTQLADEVSAMNDQAETVAGNFGNRLSGGQKARLALARTLFSNRKVLLLDDPFASVDSATTQKILTALKESYQDALILLVSHRVTLFEGFDQVLVIDKKSKPLFGTHQSLLKSSNVYRDLVKLQEGDNDDAR